MALVSQIITDAYRESNLIALGASPTAAQSAEALRLLDQVVSSMFGHEMGEQLDDLPIGSNNISRPSGFPWSNTTLAGEWVVPKNARLILNLTAPLTVYLNPMPDAGSFFGIMDLSNNLATYPLTVMANGRTIGGATSLVVNTNATASTYFYRHDIGDWVLISPLATTSTFPFPKGFEPLFTILLAQRLNPRYGATMAPESQAILARGLTAFKARYRQHIQSASDPALRLLPSRKRGQIMDSRYAAAAFNSGYPYPGLTGLARP